MVNILQAGRIFVLFQVVESEITQSHFLLRLVVAVIPDEFKRFGVVFTGLFFGLAAVEDPELSSIEGTLVLRGLRFHVLCEDLVAGVNVLLTFGGIGRLVLGSNINVTQTKTFGSVGFVADQLQILLVVGDRFDGLLVGAKQHRHAAIAIGLSRILFESLLVVLNGFCTIVQAIGGKTCGVNVVTIQESRVRILLVVEIGDAFFGMLEVHRFHLGIEEHTTQHQVRRSEFEQFFCDVFDRREVRLIHQRDHVVLARMHVVDRRIGCAVEILFVGSRSLFEFVSRVGNVAKFLVSREIVGLALENLGQCFFSHDGVHKFVNTRAQTQGFDVVGLDIQNLIELLSGAAPVFSEHAHLCLQHKSRHILRINGIGLLSTLVGARIDLLFQEEIADSHELFLVVLDFLDELSKGFVGFVGVVELIGHHLVGHCLHVGLHSRNVSALDRLSLGRVEPRKRAGSGEQERENEVFLHELSVIVIVSSVFFPRPEK